jgi:hypothetical protein
VPNKDIENKALNDSKVNITNISNIINTSVISENKSVRKGKDNSVVHDQSINQEPGQIK